MTSRSASRSSPPPAAPRRPRSPAGRLPRRALRLVAERFPLALHGPAILAFVLANAAVAHGATAPGRALGLGPRLAVIGVLAALVFLRMRLFDEVKDQDHDRRHHPGRPLPRGLVTAAEVNRLAVLVAAVEGALAGVLGGAALGAWAAVLAYTLLMRVEFGVRAWLRPRLLLYALAHTPSGGLLGLLVAAAVTGRSLGALPAAAWVYALAGWAWLMVFEVARKTRDPVREPSPDTYSTRHGAGGAALLNALFVVLGGGLTYGALALAGAGGPGAALALGVAVTPALALVAWYGAAPTPRAAAAVRLAAQALVFVGNVLPVVELVRRAGLALQPGW